MSGDDLKLAARKRSTGKAGRRELAESDVRGVVYGKTQDPIAITTNYNEFAKVFKQAGGNQIVAIDIEGDEHDILFKEVDFDPVSNHVRHFDAYAITRGEKITVSVPVELEGDAPAEKTGLNVVVLIETVEVSTIPRKIPEKFTLSQESLVEVGDGLNISDIAVNDEEIEILDDPTGLIAKVEEVQELQVEDDSPDAEMPDSEHGAEGDEGSEEGEGGEDGASSDTETEKSE